MDEKPSDTLGSQQFALCWMCEPAVGQYERQTQPKQSKSSMRVYKELPVGGDSRRYIQLRLEAYNASNHANFASPNGNFGAGSPAFGSINSVDQPVNTSGDPQPGRAIQLGGKFYF
jgi:hypothetical protein